MPSTLASLGPVERLWFTEPASTIAGESDAIYMFIFWISVVFFVGIVGAMTYFVFKYRRIPGKPQERSSAHNTPLEVSWTLFPSLLLLVMFVWGFKAYLDMQVSPANAEEIRITAYQWNWEATYDNGAGSGADTVRIADKDVPVIRVPADRPIKLIMNSRDVIHSFFVADFRQKMDIFPNRYSTTWFHATSTPEPQFDPDTGEQIGTWKDHILYCTEYCGEGHSQMLAIIRVMPDAEYRQWKAAAQNVFKDDMTPSEVGGQLYFAKGCNACHSVDGAASTGPTWQGLYGTERTFRDASPTVADENYIRESILEPEAKIVEGFANQMQTYQGRLSERELDALIAYMKTLSQSGRDELGTEQTYGEMTEESEGEGEG